MIYQEIPMNSGSGGAGVITDWTQVFLNKEGAQQGLTLLLMQVLPKQLFDILPPEVNGNLAFVYYYLRSQCVLQLVTCLGNIFCLTCSRTDSE